MGRRGGECRLLRTQVWQIVRTAGSAAGRATAGYFLGVNEKRRPVLRRTSVGTTLEKIYFLAARRRAIKPRPTSPLPRRAREPGSGTVEPEAEKLYFPPLSGG